MDETRQHATPPDAGWPQPGETGQGGGSRRIARPDLRVSDAERDAVVTELSEHFQQGRLDQAEFDERLTQALAARTESDLSKLLADLPSLRETSVIPQSRGWAPRLPFLVPLIFAFILIAGSAGNGRHGGWVLWPLLWIVPIIALRLAWWRRGWQHRRWQ